MSAGNTGRYGIVRRESQPHVEDADPEVLSNQQVAATFRPGVRVPWVIVSVVLTGIVSIVCTYMSTHKTESDPSALLLEFRTSMATQAEESKRRADALDHRLDVVETNLSVIRGSIDTLRDRLNDKH